MNTNELVKYRSRGRCEYYMVVRNVRTRCFRAPIEIHHLITRARGGLLLDAVGETAHLIALCRQHHNKAHQAGAHEEGLLIDGYVTTGPNGRPQYQGSHFLLSSLYGVDDG